MEAFPLMLVLASAVLHASWNLVIKASDDRLLASATQVVFGALLFSPLLLVGEVPASVFGAIAASSVVHLGYSLSLATAYRRGELSLVYPVARGIAPVIVTLAAVPLLDDIPSPRGLLAIALVVAGVLLVAQASRADGLGWALITGGAIASYTLIDAAAVRSLDTALPYTAAVFMGNALLYIPLTAWRRSGAQVKALLATEWRRHLLAGLASVVAYSLVLAAARLEDLGLVSAFRETSVVFGALGAWLILGEADAKRRLRGASLIVAGLATLVIG